jgi:hypothetical protein
MRFVDRSARKLARESFHGMAIYQAKMERKQGFLFRCVDVVMELFAMTAAMSHARRLKDLGRPEGKEAIELADLFCRQARRRVQRSFRDLWSNEDATLNKVAGNVMQGRHEWLGQGRMDLGFTAESFRTRYISESKTEEKPRVAAASSGSLKGAGNGPLSFCPSSRGAPSLPSAVVTCRQLLGKAA